MRCRNILLALLVLSGACSTPDAETGDQGPAAPVTTPEQQVPDPEPDNGQTGSIGQAECTEDQACVAPLESWLAEFEMPATYWHTFDASECRQVGIIADSGSAEGLACWCSVKGSDGGVTVGPQGLACSNYGRRGDCIYTGEEFPSCDPADASSCEAICADLETRAEADAMVTYETEVRLARCRDYHCEDVVRIGDRCFRAFNSGVGFDCSLTDDDILAMSQP